MDRNGAQFLLFLMENACGQPSWTHFPADGIRFASHFRSTVHTLGAMRPPDLALLPAWISAQRYTFCAAFLHDGSHFLRRRCLGGEPRAERLGDIQKSWLGAQGSRLKAQAKGLRAQGSRLRAEGRAEDSGFWTQGSRLAVQSSELKAKLRDASVCGSSRGQRAQSLRPNAQSSREKGAELVLQSS